MSLGQVERALDILETLVSAGPPETRLSTGGLSRLKRAVSEARSVADPLVRVALVGEFNTGKSTLLNAILGRDVAATDIFEMTSWIAVYRPGMRDRCELMTRDGGVSEIDLELFYRKCVERAWSAAELAEIERVEIELAGTELPLVLIDPPGFGSITRENEGRLLEALGLADLVLWLVEVDGIGGIHDVALIERLREKGTPIGAVLTKVDLLENPEEELEELLDYLSARSGVAAAEIHTVAALQEQDPGVEELKAHLVQDVVPARERLRRQAASSHFAMAREEAGVMLDETESWLRDLCEDEAYRADSFALQATVVREEVLARMDSWVQRTFLMEHRQTLLRELASTNAFGTKDLGAVFSKVIPPTYLDTYWQRLLATANELLTEEWAKFDIDASSLQLSRPGTLGVLTNVSTQALPASTTSGDQVLDISLKSTVGTAAAATAWAAWLGPAAAQVSIGAALTGVGIPIALLGLGVSYVLARHYRKGTQNKNEEVGHEVIAGLAAEFSQATVRGPLAMSIDIAHEEFTAGDGTTLIAGKLAAVWLDEVRALRRHLHMRLIEVQS